MLAITIAALLAAAITPTAITIGLLVLIRDERHATSLERASWASERATLLQRIQAPEQAVTEHSTQGIVPAAPAPALEDAAYWNASGLELSKEELALQTYQADLA